MTGRQLPLCRGPYVNSSVATAMWTETSGGGTPAAGQSRASANPVLDAGGSGAVPDEHVVSRLFRAGQQLL